MEKRSNLSDKFLCTTFHPNPCHSCNTHKQCTQIKQSGKLQSTTKENINAEQSITIIRVFMSPLQLVTCWPQHKLIYQMELHYIQCKKRIRNMRFGVPKVVNINCMNYVTIWVQNTNTYRGNVYLP